MANRDEIKEVVLEYVIEEYLEDDDEEITFDTPLISGGFVDSFSMVSLKRFIKSNTKYQFLMIKPLQKHSIMWRRL